MQAESGHQGVDTLALSPGGGGQPQQDGGALPHEGGRTQPGFAPSLLPRDQELDDPELYDETEITMMIIDLSMTPKKESLLKRKASSMSM